MSKAAANKHSDTQIIIGSHNLQKHETNHFYYAGKGVSKSLLIYRVSAIFIAFIMFFTAVESLLENGLNPALEIMFLVCVPVCLSAFLVHLGTSHFKKK